MRPASTGSIVISRGVFSLPCFANGGIKKAILPTIRQLSGQNLTTFKSEVGGSSPPRPTTHLSIPPSMDSTVIFVKP